MKILHKILIAMLTVATPLLWSCSDKIDFDSEAPGAMTISLYSNGGTEALTSRSANVGNREFYIGKTHLFFYKTSDDKNSAALYHRSFDGSDWTTRSLRLSLDDDVVGTLFGEDGTTCSVYAVSNVPEDLEKKLNDNSSINDIKELELTTDFSKDKSFDSFVMDGISKVTLDRDNSTMSGSISLNRAAVKVSLNVFVQDTIKIAGDGTYTPSSTSNINKIDFHNALSRGRIEGSVDNLGDNDYIAEYTNKLSKSAYTAKYKGGTYYWYTAESFYTYPTDWTNTPDRDTSAKICIPWKKEETDGNISYHDYYYEISIPTDNTVTKLERNKNYSIYVYLSVLGGKLEGEALTPTPSDLSFEVADWTNDGADITTTLDRSHYLVVQDNSFEVFNENSVSFEYQSCNSIKAYVSEVKYVSTRYDEEETIYLYKADYNSTNNDYEEISDDDYNEISTNQSTVRSEKSAIVSAVKAKATPKTDGTCDMLSWTEVSDQNSESVNGTVTLTYNVEDLAEKFYRPITYTVVVVNDKNHAASRQTVTITQYPSKYIEFGVAGNVFVNGYYARLTPDLGYSVSDLPVGYMQNVSENGVQYYKSYNFYYSGYGTNSTGEYYSSSNNNRIESSGSSAVDYGFWSNASVLEEQKSVNSSYGYVRGKLAGTALDFKNTLDVYVTAFSSSDKTFVIKYNSKNETRTYRIGDPRVKAGYTNMTSHSSSYTRTGETLYEYLISGNSQNSNYYRYVSPWKNVDEIKIGGTDLSYDNIISPSFKFESSYGAPISTVNFDVAQKRCATYQEAGYPAGRWRLPTLAEIAFILNLQREGVIKAMFGTNTSGYWTCTGSKIGNNISGTNTNDYTPSFSNTSNALCFARCVYDLWYWGDKQVTPTHVFHPMPTK